MHMNDISGVIGVQSRFSECSHIMIYIGWTTTIYNTIRFVCLDLCKLTDDKKTAHESNPNQITICTQCGEMNDNLPKLCNDDKIKVL